MQHLHYIPYLLVIVKGLLQHVLICALQLPSSRMERREYDHPNKPRWSRHLSFSRTILLKMKTLEASSGPGLHVRICKRFTPTANISMAGERSAGTLRTSGGMYERIPGTGVSSQLREDPLWTFATPSDFWLDSPGLIGCCCWRGHDGRWVSAGCAGKPALHHARHSPQCRVVVTWRGRVVATSSCA